MSKTQGRLDHEAREAQTLAERSVRRAARGLVFNMSTHLVNSLAARERKLEAARREVAKAQADCCRVSEQCISINQHVEIEPLPAAIQHL